MEPEYDNQNMKFYKHDYLHTQVVGELTKSVAWFDRDSMI